MVTFRHSCAEQSKDCSQLFAEQRHHTPNQSTSAASYCEVQLCLKCHAYADFCAVCWLLCCLLWPSYEYFHLRHIWLQMQFTVQLIFILFEHCALCDRSVSVVVRTSCGWSFTEATQLPVGGASKKLHSTEYTGVYKLCRHFSWAWYLHNTVPCKILWLFKQNCYSSCTAHLNPYTWRGDKHSARYMQWIYSACQFWAGSRFVKRYQPINVPYCLCKCPLPCRTNTFSTEAPTQNGKHGSLLINTVKERLHTLNLANEQKSNIEKS